MKQTVDQGQARKTMTDRTPNASRHTRRHGFTLIELMVSIAMVLILILGVNAIFKMASDTVNAGNAMASGDRDNRAATSVLYDDFRTAVINDGPMLLIRSERFPAFRNRDDALADRDGNPLTTDLNGDNREGDTGVRGELTGPLTYNNRNHRVDRVGFFSNQLYRRQTGTHNAAQCRFTDDGASGEAYVWYGHLDQPNGKPLTGSAARFEHRGPGELLANETATTNTNPNNYFATDWILGRVVTLLREQPVAPGTPLAQQPNYFEPPLGIAATLSPLSPESRAKFTDISGNQDFFNWSRYDLAKTSIASYKQTLQNYIADGRVGGYDIKNDSVWYDILGGRWGTGGNSARFHGYAFPDKPLTPYGVSQTVPVFVRGCTQFMVEYAGDYLNQKPDGTINGTYLDGPAGTDGQVDFSIVLEQPGGTGTPFLQVRRTRWYGMPRNVDVFDDTIAGPVIMGGLGNASLNSMRDVVPLRDVLLAAGAGPKIPLNFFEHFENLEPMANYGVVSGVAADPKALRYYAAWGPADLAGGSLARPKMLRITMTVDDPNGRITAGQTYEYVINLP